MSPIRYRLVLKYTGGALLVLGVALLITASVSFTLGEFSFIHYTVPGVCTVLVGWYLARRVDGECNIPSVHLPPHTPSPHTVHIKRSCSLRK